MHCRCEQGQIRSLWGGYEVSHLPRPGKAQRIVASSARIPAFVCWLCPFHGQWLTVLVLLSLPLWMGKQAGNLITLPWESPPVTVSGSGDGQGGRMGGDVSAWTLPCPQSFCTSSHPAPWWTLATIGKLSTQLQPASNLTKGWAGSRYLWGRVLKFVSGVCKWERPFQGPCPPFWLAGGETRCPGRGRDQPQVEQQGDSSVTGCLTWWTAEMVRRGWSVPLMSRLGVYTLETTCCIITERDNFISGSSWTAWGQLSAPPFKNCRIWARLCFTSQTLASTSVENSLWKFFF